MVFGYIYEKYSEDPVKDPLGPTSGRNRVFRGGSWNSIKESCRSGYRDYTVPDDPYADHKGFRVVIEE